MFLLNYSLKRENNRDKSNNIFSLENIEIDNDKYHIIFSRGAPKSNL